MKGSLLPFVVCGFVLTIVIAISCELRSDCLEKRCSEGLQPVWLHHDAACVCAERPR